MSSPLEIIFDIYKHLNMDLVWDEYNKSFGITAHFIDKLDKKVYEITIKNLGVYDGEDYITNLQGHKRRITEVKTIDTRTT